MPLDHVAILLRYAGISFIAGSVNHGMFSQERSQLTALAGVLLFLVGSTLEMRQRHPGERRWTAQLGFGVLASIGLGFFTGGLQHFPDSPERSVWVVPVGFLLSFLAFYVTEYRGRYSIKSISIYGLSASAVVIVASLLARSILLGHEGSVEAHHQPAHQGSTKNLVIEANDLMRFVPSSLEIREGEEVRIILVNTGRVRHELVIGDEESLGRHAMEMKQSNEHHHDTTGISVEPGQVGMVVWRATTTKRIGFACFEPGHFEAGMRGTVSVVPG